VQAFIARQPVFDGTREVFGYELLFRSGPENVFSSADGDRASTKVMSDSMLVHGLDALTTGRKAFVNVTRNILLDEAYTIMPPESTVVELLETVEPDNDVVEACRKLRRNGYLLALDDFVFESKYEKLLRELDILKVDFAATSPEQRAAHTRRNSGEYRLLAEKVETYEEFQEAGELGYAYFQGYFFCRPEMLCAREIPGFKLNYLRILAEINKPDLDLDQLERVIQQDVALSYKLLKYLNSASFGMRNRVNSIRHAMTLLGEKSLRKWASLIAMNSMGVDKPSELLSYGLIRARMCELVSAATPLKERQHDLFITGMFSVIDALIDRPIDEVLAGIPIANDVKDTLLGESTDLTPVFRVVLAILECRLNDMNEWMQRLSLDEAKITECYRDAIVWANEVFNPSSGAKARKAS